MARWDHSQQGAARSMVLGVRRGEEIRAGTNRDEPRGVHGSAGVAGSVPRRTWRQYLSGERRVRPAIRLASLGNKGAGLPVEEALMSASRRFSRPGLGSTNTLCPLVGLPSLTRGSRGHETMSGARR
jgi:hypothetical protein